MAENKSVKDVKETSSKTPRVKVVGGAFVITSKLKFDSIKKMEKLSNESLCLIEIDKDEEVNEIFRIGTGRVSSIGTFGVTYNEANKDGYAIATATFPADVTDKKAFIKDNLAKALLMLDELEEHVAEDLVKLEERYAELDKEIEIVD